MTQRRIKMGDYQYIVLYLYIGIISLFLGLGIQNITFESFQQWNLIYISLNLIISAISFFNIILLMLKKRILEYTFSSFLFIFVLSMSIISILMFVLFPIEGGSLFRMSYSIFIPIILLIRILSIKLYIEEGA